MVGRKVSLISTWLFLIQQQAGGLAQQKRALCRHHPSSFLLLSIQYDLGADEHYVPTLLAYLGKDQETDCWGFLVNVDWSRGGAHPRTYAVEDIDAER